MPKLKTEVPKLNRLAKGGAFIKVNGQQIWLGKYGEPLTREMYDRTVATWLANGRRMPVADPKIDDPITISMLLVDYLRSIQGRFRPCRRRGHQSGGEDSPQAVRLHTRR